MVDHKIGLGNSRQEKSKIAAIAGENHARLICLMMLLAKDNFD